MRSRQRGFVIPTLLMLLVLIGLLLATHFIVTRSEIVTGSGSANSTSGFYAAEGGLNLRAEKVRRRFQNYETPSGSGPTATAPCQGSNTGSGDLGCETASFGARTVQTYVNPQAGTNWITIPAGELYQNLQAEERRYDVMSQSVNNRGDIEAITRMTFKVRNVPLFQFAIFYDKDLEFTNTAALDLSGPVHANGDIYLDTGETLKIHGQVTASGGIWRGQKFQNDCYGNIGAVTVDDNLGNPDPVDCSGRYQLTNTQLDAWGGTMQQNVERVQVPTPDAFVAQPGKLYFDKADLRVAMNVTSVGGAATFQILGAAGVPITTFNLNACPDGHPFTTTYSFRDNRESRLGTLLAAAGNRGTKRQMMEVNLGALLSCIGSTSAGNLGVSGGLANTSEGGLVIHFSVNGPKANPADRVATESSPYGIRIRNGSTMPTAMKGLTVVSDQAVYIMGDYNTVNKKPASILADVVNVLSNAWDDQVNYASMCKIYSGGQWYYFRPKDTAVWAPLDTDPWNVPTGTSSAWTYQTAVQSTWSPSAFPQTADIAPPSGTGPLDIKTASTAAANLALLDRKSMWPTWCRTASETTVNAAIVGGTDTTGDAEGATGRDIGNNNGGVHNMMRFHEDWGAGGGASYTNGQIKYNYTGSLVSLGLPVNSKGRFNLGPTTYAPPRRVWAFDTSFRNIDNLPPLSPRFVYLRQEMFNRDFQR